MSDLQQSTIYTIANFVFVGLIKDYILKYVKKTKTASDMMTERM